MLSKPPSLPLKIPTPGSQADRLRDMDALWIKVLE
jgi:hypothetical protein